MDDKVLNKFIELATIDGRTTEDGNAKKQNKNYDLIQRLYENLKTEGKVELLVPLLDHGEKYVRLWAATFLLPVDTDSSVSVLERLVDEKGLISITAKWTLKEWKKGLLKL